MGATRDSWWTPAGPPTWFPLLSLLVGLVACGGTEQATSPEVAAGPVVIPGTYDVSGTTVESGTGSQRSLEGTITLHSDGDTYTASFNLSTRMTSAGESTRAELVGTGSGSIQGDTLVGSAETQVILALVPGVDPGFALLPRGGTTRIMNSSRAVVSPDGTVKIQIESEGAPGSDYTPTRTTLTGKRVDVLGRDRT